jgi:hypothetical protein
MRGGRSSRLQDNGGRNGGARAGRGARTRGSRQCGATSANAPGNDGSVDGNAAGACAQQSHAGEHGVPSPCIGLQCIGMALPIEGQPSATRAATVAAASIIHAHNASISRTRHWRRRRKTERDMRRAYVADTWLPTLEQALCGSVHPQWIAGGARRV